MLGPSRPRSAAPVGSVAQGSPTYAAVAFGVVGVLCQAGHKWSWASRYPYCTSDCCRVVDKAASDGRWLMTARCRVACRAAVVHEVRGSASPGKRTAQSRRYSPRLVELPNEDFNKTIS